jgi:hypothetical protein
MENGIAESLLGICSMWSMDSKVIVKRLSPEEERKALFSGE